MREKEKTETFCAKRDTRRCEIACVCVFVLVCAKSYMWAKTEKEREGGERRQNLSMLEKGVGVCVIG